jgi:hypothetical protein
VLLYSDDKAVPATTTSSMAWNRVTGFVVEEPIRLPRGMSNYAEQGVHQLPPR